MKYGPISDETLASALKHHSAEDIDIARMAEELSSLRLSQSSLAAENEGLLGTGAELLRQIGDVGTTLLSLSVSAAIRTRRP